MLGDGETDFFFLDGVGEGDADSFFVVAAFFLLCGVGVGVEKTFLIFSPTDSSAPCVVVASARNNVRITSPRSRIEVG